jgi:hypothetical protein
MRENRLPDGRSQPGRGLRITYDLLKNVMKGSNDLVITRERVFGMMASGKSYVPDLKEPVPFVTKLSIEQPARSLLPVLPERGENELLVMAVIEVVKQAVFVKNQIRLMRLHSCRQQCPQPLEQGPKPVDDTPRVGPDTIGIADRHAPDRLVIEHLSAKRLALISQDVGKERVRIEQVRDREEKPPVGRIQKRHCSAIVSLCTSNVQSESHAELLAPAMSLMFHSLTFGV